MHLLDSYQLFLFDFDGLLVNTEELHYKAYLALCKSRGCTLNWSFRTYMRHALYSATGLKEGIYNELPELKAQEDNWEILYREKTALYNKLLETEKVTLMPGAEPLLQALAVAEKKRCVVTHSKQEQINSITKLHPILNTLPHWITREHYSKAKPSSECYEKAIQAFLKPGEKAIGFEDSPRGLQALLGTQAEAVLVSDCLEPGEIHRLAGHFHRPFTHIPTLNDLSMNLSQK